MCCSVVWLLHSWCHMKLLLLKSLLSCPCFVKHVKYVTSASALCVCVVVLLCVNVIQSFTYVLCVVIWTSQEDMGRDSMRESERELQQPLACTIKKKRRNKIRNLWLWLVCCCLLPTCYFHRPFTSIRGKSIIELITDGDLTVCAVHCVCVQNSELDLKK